ncbi:MAG TPA: TIR domain-containing protein [Micropepsaceae bacterium]|nr:TIR domain-containing protein [Micropepsaceae bacterium]
MAKINQDLLDRLAKRIGVGKPRVYSLIQDISAKNRVPRHLGALLLAGDNGISIQKYATDQDLSDLRGIPRHASVETHQLIPTSAITRRREGKARPANASKTKENTVFVVHGRDSKLRDAMYEFLGAIGLKPREWGHAIRAARGRGGNPYVNDAVSKIMEQAQAIVVMLSPDDDVHLKPQFVGPTEKATEGRPRGQARPNVIFETGLAIGTHHRKTVIVQVGDVKPFTDIGGMHILRLSGTDASRHELANRLEDLGCKIDRGGDHWLRAGDFTATPANGKRVNRKKTKTR